MKRQVAVTGNASQTVSFVEWGIFVLCIFWCPEGAVWFSCLTEAPASSRAGPTLCGVLISSFLPLRSLFLGAWHPGPSKAGAPSPAQSSLGVNGRVCASSFVCVSPLLHHDGWILPLEICIFRMRVGFFLPSKCTHFVLNTVATTSYRHLSDAESISSVVGDTLSAAGPREPGGFPAPWGPCHEGGDRALQGQMGGMCSCFGWVGSKLGYTSSR